MNYYELYANTKNKQLDLLTYSSKQKLTPGQHVSIDVRSKTTNGVVINKVEKPEFEANPINGLIDDEPNVSDQILSRYQPESAAAAEQQASSGTGRN